MVNDIARKMSDIQLSCYREDIELYLRVIKQERSDKEKVYSLHESEVERISKGEGTQEVRVREQECDSEDRQRTDCKCTGVPGKLV